MKYCLDTSVYIQAHRAYYAFDMAPGFWKSLILHADGKAIISPSAVYKELTKGHDELEKWAKENKSSLFIDPDEKVIDILRQIADFASAHYDDSHWVSEFMDGADPWVIAQAKAHNLTVVTMESSKGNEEINPSTKRVRGKLKIPNMCGHFGVKCISTYDLIRALKIGLG